jgi:hypothetical protein
LYQYVFTSPSNSSLRLQINDLAESHHWIQVFSVTQNVCILLEGSIIDTQWNKYGKLFERKSRTSLPHAGGEYYAIKCGVLIPASIIIYDNFMPLDFCVF